MPAHRGNPAVCKVRHRIMPLPYRVPSPYVLIHRSETSASSSVTDHDSMIPAKMSTPVPLSLRIYYPYPVSMRRRLLRSRGFIRGPLLRAVERVSKRRRGLGAQWRGSLHTLCTIGPSGSGRVRHGGGCRLCWSCPASDKIGDQFSWAQKSKK